jgi:4a-hydroxytetrahydrobiopterin dehydratase
MPYAPLLTDAEIDEGLAALPDWQREGDAIRRTVRCATFLDAISLVNRVAEAAEAADHHPDILINWRRVTFTSTTYASKGLTAKDLAMAATIDRLASEAGADAASG